MKKIIHFSLANSRSGMTQYVLNNWRYIDRTRFQFDVVTFGGKLDFQEDLEMEGCKVFYVKNRAEENWESFQREILEIFSNHYDAVHLNTSYWKSFELENLARQAQIPKIIIHSHNGGVFDDVGREEKEKRHYLVRNKLTDSVATDFWACSEVAARWLYGDRIPKDRIRILKNGVDTQKFSYNAQVRAEYRKRLKWEDMFIIGHIGRFSYQKNHLFLIRVFYEIAKLNKKVRLLLVGKGVLETKIQSTVREYGISDKVHFAGVSDDVSGWYQAMDLFCLPSRFEGFPIVMVEAQSAGVPIILSNKITEEVKIMENIVQLPLEETVWVSRIKEEIELAFSRDVVTRAKGAAVMKVHGYDIRDSIRTLEKLYEGMY